MPGATLDDATRMVPFCAFALSENTRSFLPVFKRVVPADVRDPLTTG